MRLRRPVGSMHRQSCFPSAAGTSTGRVPGRINGPAVARREVPWPRSAQTCSSPEAGGADGTPDAGTRTGGELPGCRCRSSIEERKRQCSARLWAASERVGRPSRFVGCRGEWPIPRDIGPRLPSASVGAGAAAETGEDDAFPAMSASRGSGRRLRPAREQPPSLAEAIDCVPRSARSRALEPTLLHADARPPAARARSRASAAMGLRARARAGRPSGRGAGARRRRGIVTSRRCGRSRRSAPARAG